MVGLTDQTVSTEKCIYYMFCKLIKLMTFLLTMKVGSVKTIVAYLGIIVRYNREDWRICCHDRWGIISLNKISICCHTHYTAQTSSWVHQHCVSASVNNTFQSSWLRIWFCLQPCLTSKTTSLTLTFPTNQHLPAFLTCTLSFDVPQVMKYTPNTREVP